jgi:hypothetical protein
VYCKNRKRRLDHEHTPFTFLGYTFRARKLRPGWDEHVHRVLPAVSKDGLTKMSGEVRRWQINLCTTSDIGELVEWMNSVIRGWRSE